MELLVASGVLATALAMLAGVLTSGLTATGYARERQAATELANQTLETIRSLPFNTMKAGLQGANPGDDLVVNPDPNITASGCGSNYCFKGEQVAMHTGGGSVDPLVPHVKTVTVGTTTFTVSAYVTYYNNVTTSDARRVTVDVTWRSPLKGNQLRAVEVETIIYSAFSPSLPAPSGQICSPSPANHPFPGPCQPSFTAHAIDPAGIVSLAGTISGLGLDHLTLSSGRATSDGDVEQVSNVEGLVQASGARIQAAGGAEQTLGLASVSSKADNDPSGVVGIYDSRTLAPPVGANVTVPFGPSSVTVSTSVGDSGSTTSTTSACTTTCSSPATPSPRTCPAISGITNETDLLECGGSAEQTAAVSATANLATVGSVALATVGAQTNPVVATTNRTVATTGNCTGDGCYRATVTRAVADISAGGLPSNLNPLLKPLGFTSFVRMQGITDSVSAEAGINASAPSATQSTGTITVYCASAILGNLLCSLTGYVTKALNEITSAVTLPTLQITDALLGGGTTISISATITPATKSTSSNCSGTCTRTTAVASSTPPTVSVTYTITVAGTTLLNTTVVLNPGTITAKATYNAAPLT